MRVQVDLRAGDGAGELLHAIGGASLSQIVSEIFRVIISDHHASGYC